MSKSITPSADSLEHDFANLEAELAKATLTSAKRKNLEARLQSLMGSLGRLLDRIDPVSQPSAVFDPSNPKIIGRFVSLALVAQKRHPLADIPRAYGSGVYAIYYAGDLPIYAAISGSETPIYVGQAAPASNHARTPREQGDKLSARLTTHKRNIIKAASTLAIEDFNSVRS